MKNPEKAKRLLVKNYAINRATSLTKGKVIAHSKDRDEIQLNNF